MIFTWLLHKIKAFLLIFVNLFRRALCCFRRRRHSTYDTAPLTHVVSGVDQENDFQNWSNWGEERPVDKPKTVQDYIEQYRQQTVKACTTETSDEKAEDNLNLFEDMSPKITKQMKVLVRTKKNSSSGNMNRLNVMDHTVNVVPSADLAEWDENNGWEGEQLLDREAQKILREQKKLEREKKAWEQHQKRLEKASSKSLGSKLST